MHDPILWQWRVRERRGLLLLSRRLQRWCELLSEGQLVLLWDTVRQYGPPLKSVCLLYREKREQRIEKMRGRREPPPRGGTILNRKRRKAASLPTGGRSAPPRRTYSFPR